MNLRTCQLIIALVAIVGVGLHGYTFAAKPPAQDKKTTATAEKLEPYECGKVKRLHTLGGVFLASQPQPEDFQDAKDGGIKTVVNLRRHDELDWDEAGHVKELGMAYHNIPFKAPDTLTDKAFAEIRKLLNDSKKAANDNALQLGEPSWCNLASPSRARRRPRV
jgi:hypothetical protein